MTAILVEAPGALTTVQDLGRPGVGHLGVSACGAADSFSLRSGNRIVGNPDGTAALEMTLVGGAFRFDAPLLAAVTGSDFGPRLESAVGRAAAVRLHQAFRVEAGDLLRFGPTRSGARCYLCVRGGIDAPLVLGSASTHLASGLGGMDGRPLRAGDTLHVGRSASRPPIDVALSLGEPDSILFRRVLRVTDGPQRGWFTAEALATFHSSSWEVTEEADRMGLRLRGPRLQRQVPGELPTEGVCLGAVQVPEGGQPIVLFVDQQTTGGYPKIANVITADLPAVGQLRPRERVRFEAVSISEARRVLHAQERLLDSWRAGP